MIPIHRCPGLPLVKILVVDDEPKAAAHLANGLIESGYDVDVAGDGAQALAAAGNCDYDLIICDVMMPGVDGFATISKLRKVCPDVPVIFVTALDDVEAKVRGLDLGADDYLAKPFAFAELAARVRALIRRSPSNVRRDFLVIGDISLDIRSHSVERMGTTIELTQKEFSLLLILAENAGQVVSRRIIAEKVWGMDFDSGTNIIDVQVRRLRTKIELPGMPILIQTVRGVGYLIQVQPDST